MLALESFAPTVAVIMPISIVPDDDDDLYFAAYEYLMRPR